MSPAPNNPASDDGEQPIAGLRFAPGRVVPESALRYDFVSSSGPGGQNVNKRATKCTLRVWMNDLPLTEAQARRLVAIAASALTDAGEIIITADEHRSQGQNKGACEDRLTDMLKRCLVAPKPRIKTKPSRGSKERRLSEKKRRGEVKKHRRTED